MKGTGPKFVWESPKKYWDQKTVHRTMEPDKGDVTPFFSGKKKKKKPKAILV